MRILHLSGSKHHWSGNEQQLADLVHNLNPLGVESAIFCYEGSAISAYAHEQGIECHTAPRHSIYSPRLAGVLARCIREHRIDVVHAHTSNFLSLYVVADLLRGIGKPLAFSRKGLTDKANLLSRAKYNYRGIGAIICGSESVRSNFNQFLSPRTQAKSHVVYDGISLDKMVLPPNVPNLRAQLQLSEETLLVGNIANHVGDKDLLTWVEMINIVVNKIGRRDVHFVQIGGFTDDTPALQAKAQAYQLQNHITWMGKVPQASTLIPQMNLYTMSSCSEGLPISIYEAFAHRVPVVTTRAGGIAEAVQHLHTGYLTEIGDYADLAQGVDQLLSSPTLRHKLAEQAHSQLIERFTAEQSARGTSAIYRSLL